LQTEISKNLKPAEICSSSLFFMSSDFLALTLMIEMKKKIWRTFSYFSELLFQRKTDETGLDGKI